MSPQTSSGRSDDDGEEALSADIAQFVTMTRSGPWVLAYLVARRVTPGEGACNRIDERKSPFDRNGCRRLSASEFALRTGTSTKRVLALLQAWNRLAADGVVPPAADLHPGADVELPDADKYPFYGKKGYYRSWEASSLSPERKEAVEREAASSGTRPSAIAYVMQHPKAIKTALLADAATRSAAREALAEFDARQASADADDRAKAAEVTQHRQSQYEQAEAARAERQELAAQARAAAEGTQAEASMDVFNAMAEIRMAASRALALLARQQIAFTADRAEAIAELCDGAEAAITAVRDIARVVAANRGDRLERFMPSTDPARRSNQRRVFVTRYMRSGLGDEFSARDAMSAMKDMHRATTFAAASPASIARQEFDTMAQAADECITKISGIDKIGPQVVKSHNTSLLTEMIADLEARLTEPAQS